MLMNARRRWSTVGVMEGIVNGIAEDPLAGDARELLVAGVVTVPFADVDGPALSLEGDAEAVPAAGELQRAGLSHNLPVQLTSFIGRDAEMTEVLALLADSQLVTLTGAGGVGKTRL